MKHEVVAPLMDTLDYTAVDRELQVAREAGTACTGRSKLNICLSSGARVVFRQGIHAMPDTDLPSPAKPKLTKVIEVFIIERLATGNKTAASRLHAVIVGMVNSGVVDDPHPKEQQIVDFVKNWRRSSPHNSMVVVIELCDGRLYDHRDIDSIPPLEIIVLCDARQDGGSLASHLGDSSEVQPFRIGSTCAKLIRDYHAQDGNAWSPRLCDRVFRQVRRVFPANLLLKFPEEGSGCWLVSAEHPSPGKKAEYKKGH
ncbi:hypothetical protein ON010_g5456 [Phytophthora cinnamomi]|nr:hypothetical protein ON010_g5456 [Phytophthora cinnamomi]